LGDARPVRSVRRHLPCHRFILLGRSGLAATLPLVREIMSQCIHGASGGACGQTGRFRVVQLQRLSESEDGPYGTADVSPYGIDRSQLRANLKLSPAQRLEKMVNAMNQIRPLQGAL